MMLESIQTGSDDRTGMIQVPAAFGLIWVGFNIQICYYFYNLYAKQHSVKQKY